PLVYLVPPPFPRSPLLPYTTLFRSPRVLLLLSQHGGVPLDLPRPQRRHAARDQLGVPALLQGFARPPGSNPAQVSDGHDVPHGVDRKSTRLNSSHRTMSYAVFCLKK